MDWDIPCQECKTRFISDSLKRRYCVDCKKKVQMRKIREWQKKNQKRIKERLNEWHEGQHVCNHCGDARVQKSVMYCKACSAFLWECL